MVGNDALAPSREVFSCDLLKILHVYYHSFRNVWETRRPLPLHRLMSVNQSNNDYSKMNMITCSLYQYKPTMKISPESIMLLTDTQHTLICIKFPDFVADLRYLQNLIVSSVYDTTIVIKFRWYIFIHVADRCKNKHITQTPIKSWHPLAEVNRCIPHIVIKPGAINLNTISTILNTR